VLLESRGKFLVGEPFFDRGKRETVERSKSARAGRLALVGGVPRGGRLKVLRLLGRPDVARDVLEALMIHRGLERRFPPGVEKAAQQAVENVSDEPSRKDLRKLATFTIDPATARDFDDAISAEKIGSGAWRIWVHIADVAAYVKPGSAVDREAFQRSTSTYVPGLVEPMLPELLSNGVCSLVPDQDRNAVTVEFELHGAEVRKPVFYRSKIRSDRRYTYEEVDELFERGKKLKPGLAAARAAAAELQAARMRQGALEVDSSEPEFAFHDAGHVESMSRSVQTESHQLIEHLMIAANEQVAKLLSDRKLAALFRIHERPDTDRVERLLTQLASLDIATPPAPETMTSTQAAEIVAEASRLVAQHVKRTGHGKIGLTSLVLRSLQQAKYSPVNKGHAGLGLEYYCHFTSPIRRYPDLVCHRALLAALGAGEEAPRSSAMEAAAEWTSGRERDAMVIERDADAIARAFLLEAQLMEAGWQTEFDGEITGVIEAGIFVAFGDGHEGMVPVRTMRGDWWELNEPGTILLGTKKGGVLRLGDPIRVKVTRVDTAKGRTDLEAVEPG
jgi:ribonuclease R